MGRNRNGTLEFGGARQDFPHPLASETETLKKKGSLDLHRSQNLCPKKWLPISGHPHTSMFMFLSYLIIHFCFCWLLNLRVCFCFVFWSAKSLLSRKRWIWCSHLTKKRASLLKISSSLRCTWPTVCSLSFKHT
jgi:hypothetical protein